MSYTQLSSERIIQIASEFVGLGYPIPQEIVAHLGPEIIHLIQNPGENHGDTDKDTSGLDKSSTVGEAARSAGSN